MDEAKLELVQSWIRKAPHDLAAARLLATGDPPLLDVATFHCHEAAEKALKGYLVFWEQEVEKTHDLRLLLDHAVLIEPEFDTWRDMANRLAPRATRYFYPGEAEDPALDEFEEALDDATIIVNQAISFLPPGVIPPAE